MKTRVPLAAANLAAITFSCWLFWAPLRVNLVPYRLDLDVYRIGSRVWLAGGQLYATLPTTAAGIKLPFTYPPFAAIVMSPLTLIPLSAASLVVTLGAIVLLAVTLTMYLRRLRWTLAWSLPFALLLEPVRSTIGFGQVNIALMALVAADCLSPTPRWPRGMLTGLAAAVKLTPLSFMLFFLLRRDYRAAGVMGLSFAASTGLGFCLAPADSARYWASTVFDTGRIGGADYAGNQSILGTLARAGLHPGTPAATAVWLALSIAVLAVTCLGMRRALAAADTQLALALNAFAALLVSPISWSHHWVWAGPALLAFVSAARRWRHWWVIAAAGLVIFIVAPQWWFPHGGDRELHWTLWQQIAGSTYVLYAAAVLLIQSMSASSPALPTPSTPAFAAGRAALMAPAGGAGIAPMMACVHLSERAGPTPTRPAAPGTHFLWPT